MVEGDRYMERVTVVIGSLVLTILHKYPGKLVEIGENIM